MSNECFAYSMRLNISRKQFLTTHVQKMAYFPIIILLRKCILGTRIKITVEYQKMQKNTICQLLLFYIYKKTNKKIKYCNIIIFFRLPIFIGFTGERNRKKSRCNRNVCQSTCLWVPFVSSKYNKAMNIIEINLYTRFFLRLLEFSWNWLYFVGVGCYGNGFCAVFIFVSLQSVRS